MTGKQWAGRLVAVVQLACWCSVSGLLLNRGISNLTMQQEQVVGRPARGFTAGVIMVSVSCIMLLLSPTFLLMKIIDLRRRRRIFLQLAQDDLPPRYDDVVEGAPRYSSLFLVSESGDVRLLNEPGQPTIIPCRPKPHISEAAPRYSSLFSVTETGEIQETKALKSRPPEIDGCGESGGNCEVGGKAISTINDAEEPQTTVAENSDS